MKTLKMNQLTTKKKRLADALISLGMSRNVSMMLAYMQNTKSATSIELERSARLRQPEVSIATKQLKDLTGSTNGKKRSQAKGDRIRFTRSRSGLGYNRPAWKKTKKSGWWGTNEYWETEGIGEIRHLIFFNKTYIYPYLRLSKKRGGGKNVAYTFENSYFNSPISINNWGCWVRLFFRWFFSALSFPSFIFFFTIQKR